MSDNKSCPKTDNPNSVRTLNSRSYNDTKTYQHPCIKITYFSEKKFDFYLST